MRTPETKRYEELIDKSFDRGTIEADDIEWILTSDEVELLPLLHAAYQIRYRYFKNRVNIRSGTCVLVTNKFLGDRKIQMLSYYGRIPISAH